MDWIFKAAITAGAVLVFCAAARHICGLAAALAMAAPAAIASAQLGESLALASCSVALVAGVLSALAATVGPDFGGFTTGLLSSLPLTAGLVSHPWARPWRAAPRLR